MDVYSEIRKLSKTSYYQNIFSLMDKGFKIFENDKDLTPLQMFFINYLSFYSNLNTKIYLGEVDEKILDNFIYEDAYAYYDRKKKSKELRKKSKEENTNNNRTNNIRQKKQKVSSSTWMFKSKK